MAGSDFEFDERNRLMADRRRQRAALKRRHQRRQRIFFGVILLVLVLVIVLIVRGCKKADETTPADPAAETPAAETPAAQTPEETPEETPAVQLPVANVATVTISSVGDIMCYDNQIAAAAQTNGTYNFSGSFSRVAGYLSAADLTTANLETTFTDGQDYTGSVPYFNAPVDLAGNLAAAGFDLLSTANTYSILYGVSGLYSTIGHVRDANMNNVGTFYTQAERDTNGGAVLRDVNGVQVAFLAYTKNVNDMFVPEGSEYAVNILYTDYTDAYKGIKEDMLLADVAAAKAAGAEIIIVLPHWGSEYVFTTRSEQEEIADLLFANGVDAIIGSHSHVVNAMETRQVTTTDGQQKDVFIAYGLGNFLSSMDKDYTKETVILNLTFEKDLDTGVVSLKTADYVPCYILDNGPDGTAYQIVSIHDEINAYLAGSDDAVSDEVYAQLTASLDSIHNHAGADYDIANVLPTAPIGGPAATGTAALPAEQPDTTSADPTGGVIILPPSEETGGAGASGAGVQVPTGEE